MAQISGKFGGFGAKGSPVLPLIHWFLDNSSHPSFSSGASMVLPSEITDLLSRVWGDYTHPACLIGITYLLMSDSHFSIAFGKCDLRYRIALSLVQFSSVQFSCSVVSDSLQPHESQHTRPPCPSPTPGVHSDSHPSSQWCYPAISSSVVPFFSCPQSLPASKPFPISQLFAWGGQSSGVSALASFLPKKSQGWSTSEWTGWISLQSKGLSRVFSNTTVQKHQFFGTQPSSQSNSHIHTWSLEKP